MAMSFDERAAIVQRLTFASSTSPRLYRLRVVAWILLGYAMIGLLTLIAAALSIGAVTAIISTKAYVLIKVAWIPIVFALLLGRALFVRIDPPQGRMIRTFEAPLLFAMIHEIRTRLAIRRIDGVMLVADMNAAVVETPRLGGIFGWQRTLIVGLPLLLTHSTEDLKAILAHELGHLSGKHGRLAAWSWRVRETWGRVLESSRTGSGSVSRMLRRLFEWYVERLMAITLVQARSQEFAADEFSVELTSAGAAARALTWHVVATELIDQRLWKPLWERAAEEPKPNAAPLDQLLVKRGEILAPPYDAIVQKELGRTTALDDTHPSLRDRLAAIGIADPQLGLALRSAADELLGRTARSLVNEADRAWREYIGELWQQRHAELQKTRAELTAIADQSHSALSDEQLQIKADSLAELGQEAEAFELYELLATRRPTDARAAFSFGRALLQRGDLLGLDHLKRAMQHDWRLAVPACEVAYSALREKGLEREADAWADRYRAECDVIEKAQIEAGRLNRNDKLDAAELSPEVRRRLLDKCCAAGWIGKAWLGRKHLETVKTTINFLAVATRPFRFQSDDAAAQLVEELQDIDVIVFVIDQGSLMRKLDKAGLKIL